MIIDKRKRKTTGDTIVDEMMARFDYAYTESLERFITFERLQQSYDNNASAINWPTISEITFPITFTSVEEQLPFAMKYLFPKNRFIHLIPESIMKAEEVRNVEENLIYTLKTTMNIENSVFPSIKDSFKFGVGYGMIDTQFITPPQIMQNMLLEDGNVIGKIPQIVLGAPMQVLVYKYLSVIQVIPMPDGANVEGPNKASGHFVIDFKTESDFRSMYERKDIEGNAFYDGNVDKIIEEARSLNFDARALMSDRIHSLAGFSLSITNQGDRKIPVMIPVIRCNFDNEQVWIANGTTKIWGIKDKYQSLRSDVVKFSSCPDGSRWYAQNITEASERMATGLNIWYNGLIDLAMYQLNPTRIINTSLVDDPTNVARGPQGDIMVSKNAKDAVTYMDLPQFPAQLFEIGDIIQKFHGNTNAQPASVRNGQAGLVRGGGNALESMLSSSTGRQLLAACMLKTGGIQPLVEKTLIKKQLIMDQNGEKFIDVDFDKDTGERGFTERTVTMQEMRHVFRVTLNMPNARLNSSAQFAERTAFFDRAQKKPELFDQRNLFEEMAEDEDLIRRTMLPPNVVKAREERRAEAELKAVEAGSVPQAGEATATQGQQALAGAANTGGLT